MVATSKIATGNQIDFETSLSPSSLPTSIDVTCLSFVGSPSLTDGLTVSPTLSFALQIRVFAQSVAAAVLLQLNYTPRLALDSGWKQ